MCVNENLVVVYFVCPPESNPLWSEYPGSVIGWPVFNFNYSVA